MGRIWYLVNNGSKKYRKEIWLREDQRSKWYFSLFSTEVTKLPLEANFGARAEGEGFRKVETG